MVDEWWIGKDLEGSIMTESRYDHRICFEGLNKTKKTLSEDTGIPTEFRIKHEIIKTEQS
jgi:hypothetical protein